MHKKLEGFVRCEEQLWPNFGGPFNTFLPLHAVQDSKATQPIIPFRDYAETQVGVGTTTKSIPLRSLYEL